MLDDTRNGSSVRHHGFNSLRDNIEYIIALACPLLVAHVGTIACHTPDDLDLLASLDECLTRRFISACQHAIELTSKQLLLGVGVCERARMRVSVSENESESERESERERV